MTNNEARAYFIDSNERTISVAKDENGYNYETQQIEDVFMRRDFEAKEIAIQALDQQPSFINKPCVSEEVCREDKIQVLDKIRAEIKDLTYYCWEVSPGTVIDDVLKIIDKHKTESEIQK